MPKCAKCKASYSDHCCCRCSPILSEEQIKIRTTMAVHVKPVYEITFRTKNDGPFATQTLQAGNVSDIVKILKKGGAVNVVVYEVFQRPSYYEGRPVSLEDLAYK